MINNPETLKKGDEIINIKSKKVYTVVRRVNSEYVKIRRPQKSVFGGIRKDSIGRRMFDYTMANVNSPYYIRHGDLTFQ